MVLENESIWRTEEETKKGLLRIWEVMKASMYRGCHTGGILPGGLNVQRRAEASNAKLLRGARYDSYASWTQAIRNGGQDFI